MKNKTLLTAAVVVIVFTCIFAGMYSKSVNGEVVHNSKENYGRTLENNGEDEEQAEFIIWKSIPRHLLMIDR